MVEIQCHGGHFISTSILKLLEYNGLRLANPGEFTYRAYLNSKIDLIQAEAISDFIFSKNTFEASQYLSNLEKRFSQKIKELEKYILDMLVEIEVNIDYSEEDLSDFSFQNFFNRIKDIENTIEKILEENEKGKCFKRETQIILLRKTTIGKSSLFNYLSKEDRAIISSIEGTTRDYLENEVRINENLSCIIVDTAGLRDTNDLIEQAGQNKTIDFINKGDYFIWILDYSSYWDKKDEKILNLFIEKNLLNRILIIINKIDLNQSLNFSHLKDIDKNNILEISIKKEMNLERISKKLMEIITKDSYQHKFSEDLIMVNLRQEGLLKKILIALKNIHHTFTINNFEYELVALELRDILSTFGEITGKTITDETILNEIFSNFCLGK